MSNKIVIQITKRAIPVAVALVLAILTLMQYSTSWGQQNNNPNAVDMPGRPDAPRVTAVGPTSLHVIWTPPEDNGVNITGYGLFFRQDGSNSWTYWYDQSNKLATTGTITTLEPSTLYQVQVRAHTGNFGGEPSDSGTATTHSFNPSIYQLFPTGDPAKLEFNGPIAGNADGTGASHAFKFNRTGVTQSLNSAEALLTVTGPDADHDFTIQPVANTTPAQFRAVYGGDVNSVTLNGTLTASNTIRLSTELSFSLNLTYDDSPQFGPPAIVAAIVPPNNRWIVPNTYEVYEGMTTLIAIPWDALTDGTRQWTAGNPTSVEFKCKDHTETRPADWPEAGEKDSGKFTAASSSTAQSGTVTASFSATPDFETPGDDDANNTYHLRITNNHELHDLSTEGNIGCNGSAVDVTVKVKDVGAPESPAITAAVFDPNDATKINITVTEPTTFDADGTPTTFPHPDFNVSKYKYQYRSHDDKDWSTVQEATETTAAIIVTEEPGHIVRVNAVNSEGESPWTEITVGTLRNRTPKLTAPTNAAGSLLYKFPDGAPAIVTYDQEAATDADGDPITYNFRIDPPGPSGAEEIHHRKLGATKTGYNFELKAIEHLSPAEFEDLYGTTHPYVAPMSIFASDGKTSTGAQQFTIDVFYERSAYFDDADSRTTDQKFTFTEPYSVYEGAAAGSEIELAWSSHIAGTRVWAAGNPSTPMTCRDNAGAISTHTWPAAGNEDSSLLDNPTNTSQKTGTISPTFKIGARL